MNISLSEFSQFERCFALEQIVYPNGQRFGQAWYNHFMLHKHTPANETERHRLDRIYNETDKKKARDLIMKHFVDTTQ